MECFAARYSGYSKPREVLALGAGPTVKCVDQRGKRNGMVFTVSDTHVRRLSCGTWARHIAVGERAVMHVNSIHNNAVLEELDPITAAALIAPRLKGTLRYLCE
jgi:hypothetical protein